MCRFGQLPQTTQHKLRLPALLPSFMKTTSVSVRSNSGPRTQQSRATHVLSAAAFPWRMQPSFFSATTGDLVSCMAQCSPPGPDVHPNSLMGGSTRKFIHVPTCVYVTDRSVSRVSLRGQESHFGEAQMEGISCHEAGHVPGSISADRVG